MRNTKKRILGLLGLVLVVVITIFAAFLPGPEALAIDSITDTISVRVVGSVPDVEILSPANGSVFVYPDQNFSFSYENVEYIHAIIKYTGKDGVAHEFELIDDSESFVDYKAGTYSEPLDLLAENYGYGQYQITVTGDGYGGVKDFADVAFSLYPVYGEANETDDGLIYLNLQYDKDNKNIHTIVINIYDKNGYLVKAISPITVRVPGDKVELPFSENDLATGKYKIEITAYNAKGIALYKPYITYYYYENIPAPNTGGLFKGSNISRADYLVTGLLIFLSAAVLGIIFITRGKSNKRRASVRRRR